MNFLLKIYIKFQEFCSNCISFCRFFNFIYLIYKEKVFFSQKSSDCLKVLQIFINLEIKYYNSRVIMSRNNEESNKLFQKLVESYLETKSDVKLNQVLEVLKEDIIKRG